MPAAFNTSAVFINCPIDESYAPLLEAAIFCCVYLGLSPQLATNRLEAGENRLEKIVRLIETSKFSIHDLSRCKAEKIGDSFRMNMPFELGIDFGFRLSRQSMFGQKKFVIFEKSKYDLKSTLSDIAGQDVDFHNDDFQSIIRKLRDFFKVEGGIAAPGSSRIVSDYLTFQAWLIEKKIAEGHSEHEAINLPTLERIEAMQVWVHGGRPVPAAQKPVNE